MPQGSALLDFASGQIGTEAASCRRLTDVRALFAHPDMITDPEAVVYRTYAGAPDSDQPELAFATTVIEPGEVAGEFFMTRGHRHLRPERGEYMLTLGGTGWLILMDESGKCWHETMTAGTNHIIDGRHAHRVVNVGHDRLKFLVVWLTDCGHDYKVNFSSRVIRGVNGPTLKADGEPR